MRKLITSMHMSLDGFVAGPNGEMDWIHVDEELFKVTKQLTDEADTALYGRVTWQMMDAYWPTAGEDPDASRHDKDHSGWYNSVKKIVLSGSLQQPENDSVQILSEQIPNAIRQLKKDKGSNIQIFGSPSVVHLLMKQDLIDEYWLFVNPVLLGKGIPMFASLEERKQLELTSSKMFASGVVCLQYNRQTSFS
jgi:dihydrofolate reductase